MTLMLTGCGSMLGSGRGASASDQQKVQQALAASDHLIVPGERIGPIRLGMGMDEVVAILGQPDNGAKTYYGQDDVKWHYLSINLVVYFSGGTAPTVESVQTTAGAKSGRPLELATSTWADFAPINIAFRTANGVELGSTSFDAARAYSSYSYKDFGPSLMAFSDLGISFTVESSDCSITSISINSHQ